MSRSFIKWGAAALGLTDRQTYLAAQHRLSGDKARDAGDWAKAAAHYRSYLHKNPDAFAIWVQLGHALKEAGDLVGGEEAYRHAEALEPDDSDLLLNLGHLLKSMRRFAEAQRYYARSFSIDNNSQAHAELEALGVAPRLSDLQAAQRTIGSIDQVEGLVVRGWAVEPASTSSPAVVDIVTLDGELLGSGVANLIRSDVIAAGITQEPAGFAILIHVATPEAEVVHANARLRSTGEVLAGCPFTITLPSTAEAKSRQQITNARYSYVKPLASIAGEHAIFVAYAATGMIQPFVRRWLLLLRAQGISVSLVINADRPVALDNELLEIVASVLVRENKGYDFGAWAHMLRLEPKIYRADCLYIINDSIVGPSSDAAFDQMMARVRRNQADLLGLTESLERGWHVQSYFLRISADLLQSYAFQLFVNSICVVSDKDAIINAFEVPLAQRVCEAGFSVDCIFKVDEARNPTLFSWQRLLAVGFPFLKASLLRNTIDHVDTRQLEREAKRTGFDRSMLDAVRRYKTDEPLPVPGYPLLARPVVSRVGEGQPEKPYKVSFFGPWNYDNGLGSASRGIISALRQADIRLNLHPIRKPFHVHKRLVPPHDVIDFEGAADVAIVHLNPDSWHLLTDEQRAQISQAKRRIGYWVWEMEQLPEAWERDFGSVDRIWAPSTYNATVFAAAGEAPVDIVPHVVPVASDDQGDARSSRQLLGLPDDRRLILYIFDGASYLVRKNPEALLRAFAASGLADKGWSLILKTKHLMDRPSEGGALSAYADATDGVILLDRSLSPHELSDLVTSCDIYASPHCSEGFGLTVAEAMAAGRTVVATDYGGTTQYLDATCGFPVRAETWTLEEDFGHYCRGGTWARVDETALADALVDAAGRIDAGDHSMGEAARRRVADTLSVEAVSRAVSASLDALFTSSESVERIVPTISDNGNGLPLSSFREPRDIHGGQMKVLSLVAGSLTPLNDGLSIIGDSRGDWLMIVPEDARMHPATVSVLQRRAAAQPDVAIFYADDVAYGETTLFQQIRAKPQFDRTLFAAQDYIGAPLFIRGSALHELNGLRPELGDAALFDLVLRAAEHGLSIEHIPEVMLVLGGKRPVAPLDARMTLIERSALYAGFNASTGRTSSSLQLSRCMEANYPHVTLCIPTQRSSIADGEGTYIERLLNSLADVDWPADRLTVLVGDDVPGEPSWAGAHWPFTMQRVETARELDEPFNFAAKMNQLWRAAKGDVVVLLNDDVVACDGNWLRALVGFAMDREIGAVGARLLYDDGTIQHAGIYGGLLGTSAHAWLGRKPGAVTYQDWALTQREVSMVTGAVLATRRSVLEAIGGFDERFSLEFNDIDLCLKMRQQGLRIVYNPAAELIHSEKKSRGETAPPAEQLALFLARWSDWLADDPALPPRIRRDMLNLTPAAGAGDWFV